MTVCYFTGSGNCLYVARRIGGTLLSIPQLMRQESSEIVDEAVGIVCPVYNCEMPMMVRAFLKKTRIRTDYFFFVYTYGMGYGEAFAHAKLAAEDAGLTLSYINAIQMVDNFIPYFDMQEQMAMYQKRLARRWLRKDTALSYTVNDNCVHCGICAKVCPANNITVTKEKVVFSDQCEVCYACLHNCPQHAIHMPQEAGTTQFRNQDVSLQDIIAANE